MQSSHEDVDISTVAQGKRAAVPPRPRKTTKVEWRVPDDDDEIPNMMIMNPLFVLRPSNYWR